MIRCLRPRLASMLASGMLLLGIAAQFALAQDPVKLPGVVINAAPDLPGPRRLTGVVRDTSELTLDEAEVSIPSLQRRTFSKADGTFLFDDLAPGKYVLRAKKLGYAPQVRTIRVDPGGGIADFALIPIPHTMPAVVTSVSRGGLSGVIADTSYEGLPGAEVRVLGKHLFVETDSMGAFYLPAPAGSFMVTVTKAGYATRVVGVTIPADSGRYLTASMYPSSGETPVKEAWNLADLNSRLAGRDKQQTSFYTREVLKEKGIEWVNQAVVMGGLDQYDNDCAAILNGGPATINLSTLTVDDIESMEIYGSRREGGKQGGAGSRLVARPGSRPARPAAPPPANNEQRAAIQNGARYCATVYVWTR